MIEQETLVSPPSEGMVSIDSDSSASPFLAELKHSIRTHLVVMGGPTPQLAVFLTKIIDFLEDKNVERYCVEMARLSLVIVEAVALHVQQSIDARAAKDPNFPSSIRNKSDNLLVIVGKSRGLEDKMVAKGAILKEVAETLRALSTYTKSKYPSITTADGKLL